MMKDTTVSLLLLLLPSMMLWAQAPLAESDAQRLANFELEWVAPDTTYKWLKPQREVFYDTDFRLFIRKEDLEIRYLVEAVDTNNYMSSLPQLRAGQLAVHLADNSEDSHISGHELHPDSVSLHYRADWAQQFTFRPKPSFSERQHCQMIALFRDGVARAFIFLLFDEAPVSLPARKRSLRFVTAEGQNEE